MKCYLLPTYVGNLSCLHLLHELGDLRVVGVAVAAQLEPQGPVGWHDRAPNQLKKGKGAGGEEGKRSQTSPAKPSILQDPTSVYS